ncbi:MAG: Uma2 family endonuclease, partial [Rhodomicrobium sp.]
MPNRAFKFETMSADDFEELILDMPADEKWELIGGRVIRSMFGARWEHKRIVQNITVAMMNDFRGKRSACRPFDETFWLKEKLLDLQVFPDVMVRCGPLEPGAVHLSDPIVIVEVLSPGSEARDRHEKWALYQKLDSVKHYALVARDKAHVEVFSR